MSEAWWWGTYPEAGAGSPTGVGEGIWVMAPGGPAVRAIELPAPAFVVAHPDLPVLYAVTDVERAELVCLDVSDAARPTVVDRVPSGGSGACHLLLSHDTLTAYVTHCSTGEVAVVPLRTDGRIATGELAQVLQGHGSDPGRGHAAGPCAHSVGYAPTGPVLLVCDADADRIWRYEALADGSLRADGVAADLPPGSGPRHFAVRRDMIYVACEPDHTLRALRWDAVARTATPIGSSRVTPLPLRRGDSARAAHIVTVSGVLLVSVVGSDVIAVFDLGGDGVPTYRASFDSGGAFPRYFAVTGEQLVVGNEKSDFVSIFDLADVLALEGADEPGGFASLPHADVAVTSPACVAFG
jgi:6-phosphogluconolactonase (cycloisomerase 2 family)